MYKLIFFVPNNDAEKVKNAIFETGAGSIGNYSHCSFETEGTGQFKPLEGSNPSIGSINQIEKVREIKVEIQCTVDQLWPAIKALKKTHPYEVPAYEVLKLEVLED